MGVIGLLPFSHYAAQGNQGATIAFKAQGFAVFLAYEPASNWAGPEAVCLAD